MKRAWWLPLTGLLLLTGCGETGKPKTAPSPSPSASASAPAGAAPSASATAQASAPAGAPRGPYAGQKVQGVLKAGDTPSRPLYAPAKIVITDPGEYDIVRTGPYTAIELAFTPKLSEFRLENVRGAVQPVSHPITRARFDEILAGVKEQGNKVEGGSYWEIEFDQDGRVAAAHRPAGPNV
ncbi:hypothetical protein [Actinomadura macrotermitis]|uniref:Lipoprotein n=1 Tax=Actinomadura macrotermitis TaxID=2585200 RepID=A0A7K0BYT4_9ACTN|nr:hypothetical protein [Actinomadura macrotermitis]MQY06022.1 hypothetical protein [Actinomadura macrotermitis]